MKHVVILSDEEIEKALSGKLPFLLRFFKKTEKFLREIGVGDLIFFRKKRGEVLGQFEIGKLILIEKPGSEDWKIINEFAGNLLSKEIFEERVSMNRIIIIAQIEKIEQFITPPIDMPKTRKEWVVLNHES